MDDFRCLIVDVDLLFGIRVVCEEVNVRNEVEWEVIREFV